MKEVKSRILSKPSYKIDKISDFKFKIFNFDTKSSYLVEKKDVLFRKSGKKHLIWTCTCQAYLKWAWKTHTCKHLDMLVDIKEIK